MDFAGVSFPFDGPVDDDGNSPALPEDGWESVFSPLHEDGCLDYTGTGLTEGQVYADGSGMLVKRRPAPTGAMVKGHRWRDPQPDSWVVDPGDAQPRIDRVVLRLDPAGNRLGLVYRKGTPAANDLKPVDLVRVPGGIWDLPWAQIRVEAGAGTNGNAIQSITAGKVTDEKLYRSMRILQVTTLNFLTTYYGAGSGVGYGQLAEVGENGHTYRWSGASWELYVRRGADLIVPPTDWIMGVSTAFTWPLAAMWGTWSRNAEGLVTGVACSSLNVNPPYSNYISVFYPGGPLPAGRLVGDMTLANYLGQVKNSGPMISTPGGEGMLYSFGAPVWVSPANGDTVTAHFYIKQ